MQTDLDMRCDDPCARVLSPNHSFARLSLRRADKRLLRETALRGGQRKIGATRCDGHQTVPRALPTALAALFRFLEGNVATEPRRTLLTHRGLQLKLRDIASNCSR